MASTSLSARSFGAPDLVAIVDARRLGETRARFLELFADRDEPPTESQTSILQALTLMNGSFVAGATTPETGDLLGASIATVPRSRSRAYR